MGDSPFKLNFPSSVKAEFEKHISPEVWALVTRGKRIEWEEYEALQTNSYEKRLIHENLSDDALVKLYELCAKQVRPLLRYEIPRHYDDAIKLELAPLLAARLKEYVEAKHECETVAENLP